jgi:hypothetical protein
MEITNHVTFSVNVSQMIVSNFEFSVTCPNELTLMKKFDTQPLTSIGPDLLPEVAPSLSALAISGKRAWVTLDTYLVEAMPAVGL